MAAAGSPTSVWQRIQSIVPAAELDEVRRVIGNDVVERNEDLREEVALLSDILQEFQQQNENVRREIEKRPSLPEHPARVMLEQQILLLMNSCKQSTSKLAQEVLTPRSNSDIQVRDYVLRKNEKATAGLVPDRRCLSSRQGRPTTAGSSRSGMSATSAPAELLTSSLERNLSAFHIEKVRKDVRAALEEESNTFLEEVEYIQSLLDMEHEEIVEVKKEATMAPPALQDMREYSAKLEKTWVMEDLQTPADCLQPEFLKNERSKAKMAPISMTPTGGRAVRKLRDQVGKSRSIEQLESLELRPSPGNIEARPL